MFIRRKYSKTYHFIKEGDTAKCGVKAPIKVNAIDLSVNRLCPNCKRIAREEGILYFQTR